VGYLRQCQIVYLTEKTLVMSQKSRYDAPPELAMVGLASLTSYRAAIPTLQYLHLTQALGWLKK